MSELIGPGSSCPECGEGYEQHEVSCSRYVNTMTTPNVPPATDEQILKMVEWLNKTHISPAFGSTLRPEDCQGLIARIRQQQETIERLTAEEYANTQHVELLRGWAAQESRDLIGPPLEHAAEEAERLAIIRWQSAIDKVIVRYHPNRDGSGSDGDELALTIDEIEQTINHAVEAKDGEIERLTKERDEARYEVQSHEAGLTYGCRRVQKKRGKQLHKHGYTDKHDDAHCHKELARAGAYLAEYTVSRCVGHPPGWPFLEPFDPDDDDMENLVNAAAFIVAEIDRLHRAALAAAKDGE